MMHFFDILGTSQGWMYLFILSVLEIVLGIDNIIFISIVTDKLPKEKKTLCTKCWTKSSASYSHAFTNNGFTDNADENPLVRNLWK